jgi:phenylpropionate dioxygenase-like ring-hydroxylating dioxygenase large terminal subunit
VDDESPDGAFLRISRRFWHVVARSGDVVPGALVPVTLLEEQLVLGRTLDGELVLLDDLCAHRGVRLSMGSLTSTGCVRCPYHGGSTTSRAAAPRSRSSTTTASRPLRG